MKLKYITTILAVPFLLFTACNDDDPVGGNPYPENPEGMITFTLPGIKKQVLTYAGPIATDSENSVSAVDVYMFNDGSGILEKVFKVDAAALNQVGTDLTATIDVTGRVGKRNFYFVANATGNAAEPGKANVGVTTETDFKELLSDRKQGYLQNPLLMTGRTVIAAIESPTPTEQEVKLRRRVARFDIDNKAAESNFTISKVFVQGAKERGYIFSEATGIPQQTIETGNLTAINYADSANANTGMVGSVFYLYPTTLEDNGTTIAFEGIFNGQTELYSLKGGTQIEANKRYILKVKKIDINQSTLEIELEDWGDATTSEEAEPQGEAMAFEPIKLAGGNGMTIKGNHIDITGFTEDGVITIPVKSSNKTGTTARVSFLEGNAADLPGFDINTPEPILTYAAGYLQEYQITIPKPDKPALVKIKVEIINESFPEQREEFLIYTAYYPGTDLLPVVFEGLKWAPVNVGATEIGTANEVKYMGLFYQWGRSHIGFPYSSGQGTITDTITGPFNYATATTGEMKDKFIKHPSNSTTYDWLSPQNNNLWSEKNAQGPCPEGWRVPTKIEWAKLLTAWETGYTTNGGRVTWDDLSKRVVVQGDNGTDLLHFPAAGMRWGGDATTSLYNKEGRYHSSSVNGGFSVRLDFSADKMNFQTGANRDNAGSVRCVQ